MFENFQLTFLLYNLGKWAGLMGFTGLSLLIVSGDTARFFDRFFGLDKIIKFQRRFSLIAAVFVIFHPVFFILSGRPVSLLIPNFAVLPLALGAMAFYIFIVVLIASLMYKRISYGVWQYMHILTYILFFSALFHAFYWGSDSSIIYIKILYGVLLMATIAGIIYRTQYKIRKRYAGKFYVKEIKQETSDTFTMVLSPDKKFLFKAGQFCFLILNKNKLYARHPFTISNSPREQDLKFTIKKGGRFTKTAAELKKGEKVIVDGPFGIFVPKNREKDLVFVAGGVGITPFMSIIKNRQQTSEAQNILLLYGSKTKNDIIFKNELDRVNESWFKLVYILSEDTQITEPLEKGYIDKHIIDKYVKNIYNSSFYICGPESMKNSVKKILLEKGVKKQDIVIEDFFW